MLIQQLALVFSFAASIAAHGWVRNIIIDGANYPGYDPHRDGQLGMKRVAFPFEASMRNDGGTAGVQDVTSKSMACNLNPKTPEVLATVRAGSNMEFIWTKWVPSHQGPMITYMAPYTGDISKVDVNKLEFFKSHEGGLYSDGKWATDRMIAANGSWSTTIPHDIKPGTYVVRHELIALHFATSHSNYWYIPGGAVAPQIFLSCYNVNVIGNGTATPKGVIFPGAYQPADPGLKFDVFVNNKNYPIPGPPLYKPSGDAPKLVPNPLKYVSPTGTEDPAKDTAYYQEREKELRQYEQWNSIFEAMGG